MRRKKAKELKGTGAKKGFASGSVLKENDRRPPGAHMPEAAVPVKGSHKDEQLNVTVEPAKPSHPDGMVWKQQDTEEAAEKPDSPSQSQTPVKTRRWKEGRRV